MIRLDLDAPPVGAPAGKVDLTNAISLCDDLGVPVRMPSPVSGGPGRVMVLFTSADRLRVFFETGWGKGPRTGSVVEGALRSAASGVAVGAALLRAREDNIGVFVDPEVSEGRVAGAWLVGADGLLLSTGGVG